MGIRQERALQTRKNIIDAMKKLLTENAPDVINIEDITESAGVAKGSFYVYFKRKEDVISAIAQEYYENAMIVAEENHLGLYASLCVYLKTSARVIDEFTLVLAKEWMKSAVASIDGENCGVQKYEFDFANIKKLLDLACSSGEISKTSPVDELAKIILTSFYGNVAAWCMTNGAYSLEEGMDVFCRLGLKEILKPHIAKKYLKNFNSTPVPSIKLKRGFLKRKHFMRGIPQKLRSKK